jgi:hypothetical protein
MRRAMGTVCTVLILSGCVFHSHKPSTASLTGRVIDCQTGEPVEWASVVLVGTKIGAMMEKNGMFHVTSVPPGKYECLISATSYAPRRFDLAVSECRERSLGDISLLKEGPYNIRINDAIVRIERRGVGDSASISATFTDLPLAMVDTSWRTRDDAALLDEVSTVHLANFRLFVSRGLLGLKAGVRDSVINLASAASGRPAWIDIRHLPDCLAHAETSRPAQRDAETLIDVQSPECYQITAATGWMYLNTAFQAVFEYFKPGDVIVAYHPKRSDLLPNGWTGVYRQIDGRWIMIAGAFPCCRY